MYSNGGKKASPELFYKYLENPLKLGKTMIKFITVYAFKDFILIKQQKGKYIYWCLRRISITIQSVREALSLSPLIAEGTKKNV